jgi:hypothetical protein
VTTRLRTTASVGEGENGRQILWNFSADSSAFSIEQETGHQEIVRKR